MEIQWVVPKYAPHSSSYHCQNQLRPANGRGISRTRVLQCHHPWTETLQNQQTAKESSISGSASCAR